MTAFRTLTLFNEGRYLTLAPMLDRLEADGDIETWVGLVTVPRANLEPLVKPEHKSRLIWFEDGPDPYPGHAEASDYVQDLAARFPAIEFGKIYCAEKYPERRFPRGMADVARMFAALEAVQREHRLNLAFSDFPAIAMDMMAYYLFRALGGRALYFIQSRIGEKLLFISDLDRPKPEIQDAYAHALANGLDRESARAAGAYLEKFRKEKVKPSYFVDQSKPRNFFNYFRKLAYYPGGIKPGNMIRARLRRMKAKSSWAKFTFHKIDPRDRIVFFPIQYTPEASVYIRSPRFRDQAAAVSQVAMAVPPGYTVYVKDHPLLKWDRDEAYYRRLLEFPNVKLVEYSTDTHDILRVAKLTVTGSSTAGLESLLYKVPMLMLGGADTAYQDFKGVLKIGDRSMEDAVREAMALRIEDEDLPPMAHAFLSAGMPGIFDDPRWNERVLGAENTARMLAFFKHWLARMRGPA